MFSWPFKKRKRKVNDAWVLDGLVTLEQAASGIAILGETGSGKTTAVGAECLYNLLSDPSRPGFFVPCAVPSQLGIIERACRATGRMADLKYIGPGSGSFDFLNYDLSSPGGSVESAAQMIDQAVQQADRGMGGGSGDNPYWQLLQQKKTRTAIAAIWKSTGSCSIADVHLFVNTAPHSEAQKNSQSFQESCCGKVMQAGREKGLLSEANFDHDFALAYSFWLGEFPNMEPKSRSIGISMITNVTNKFLSGMIGPLVTGPTTVSPDDCLEGKVVVAGPSILTHGQPAQFFQTVFKMSVQKACQRRDMRVNPRPVVLFVDEPQYTLCPDLDTIFQSTARQSGCISIFLTQNLPTLYSAMGGGEKAKQQILGWIGNHTTKVFTANSDRESNVYASELIGQSMQITLSGQTGGDYSLADDLLGLPQKGNHGHWSEHLMQEVRPEEFTRLRKGGQGIVEGIVYQGGRRFENGKTWCRVRFRQRGN